MAKEWVLNSAMSRFQLNFKRNVGAVSEEIRKCSPKTEEEWAEYYFSHVREQKHLVELGEKLFVKISEVLQCELDQITEEDCIHYIQDVVIRRTFDGYQTEIKTIYGELQENLQCKIEPASDHWDRHYNVDFFITCGDAYIGLQIKPVTNTASIPRIYTERTLQEQSHKEFYKKFGGHVFYIYSIKEGKKKKIANIEVIEEIRTEIARLQG